MYVNVTYPKFKAWTSDGRPAAGYKVWTYDAGTSTPRTTYKDRGLSVANTNPVVLNSVGEADIYTGVPLKLVFTEPDGSPSSPIWTVDYVAEQQSVVLIGEAEEGTTNNNYVVNVTPAPTSLTNNLMLVFIPDVDNTDTMGSQNFSGTGANDAVFSGPYTGSTSGSVFTVQIDGTAFQGTGLNDLTWGGTPLIGHVYTVKISSTGTPDKFQWRKDGGTWSSEINITGGYQDLTDGVTVKFGSTTGHTVGDLWNNVDTFRWKKDGESWTSGVPITGGNQSLKEGVKIKFSQTRMHVLDDVWTVTVYTPARLNLNGLGNLIIYKNVGGTLQALDGGDIKEGIPATLVCSVSQNCWIINNPSTAAAEPPTIPPRFRKELTGEYWVTAEDEGQELSCSGTFTVHLPSCPSVIGKFFYIKNKGTGTITVAANGSDKIYKPFDTTAYSSIEMNLTSGLDTVQLVTNGVDWHIVTTATVPRPMSVRVFTSSGTWNRPAGCRYIVVEVYGGGGGGCGRGGSGGSGGTSSFGSYCSATGGGGAGSTPGSGGSGSGGDINRSGQGGFPFIQVDVSSYTRGNGGSQPAGTAGGWGGRAYNADGEAGGLFGGGGAGATGAALCSGGGAGGYSCKLIDVSGVSSVAVTVGAGGAGGAKYLSSEGGGAGGQGGVIVWEYY